MTVKQLIVLITMALLSTATYAQKGLSKTAGNALQRKIVTRAKVPTFRDGIRNLVTRRLGVVNLPQEEIYFTRSVLNFGYPLKNQQVRVSELPRIVGGRHERQGGFYSAAAPGSGNIAAIALPAYALIKQAAIAQGISYEERRALLQMVSILDAQFELSEAGEWNLKSAPYDSVHRMIEKFRTHGAAEVYGTRTQPLPQGITTVLDVLDIQTWMLAHEGKFPQLQIDEIEKTVGDKFNALMEKAANEEGFIKDPAVQGAMQHLVRLRAAARGAMPPIRVIREVLERIEKGERIPGSSPVNITDEEYVLTRELNYVEQLRRANLLHVVVPSYQEQSAIAFRLQDFQEEGHIYRQIIQIIPEFANDGVALNVPTRLRWKWETELDNWKQARLAAGLSTVPRTSIAGQWGLPINFNDLTPEEQTEVLLGTYLRVKEN